MKLFLKVSLILFFLSASVVKASDVIMATTEDLKEFDSLISKEKPTAPRDALPPAQDGTANPNQKKNKKPDLRKNFEGNPQNGQGPNGGPRGERPPPQQQPPPGQDNRPPPGSPGGPPPPHPKVN